jgi:hypothetical protein
LALIDFGYNEEQAHEYLNELDKFMNVVNEFRNRFDEDAIKIKDSNAHILKGCSAEVIMNMLLDEKMVDYNSNYIEMNSSVCQFINTIIIENMNAFNKAYNKHKII